MKRKMEPNWFYFTTPDEHLRMIGKPENLPHNRLYEGDGVAKRKKRMEMDNFKEIEKMIKEELEFLDGGNFKNRKYLKLQECDVELFVIMDLSRNDKNGTILNYLKKNRTIRNMKDLFRSQQTGTKAQKLFEQAIQGLQ